MEINKMNDLKINSLSQIKRISNQMSFRNLIDNFSLGKINLKNMVKILDYLGYTSQERRRIIIGINRNKIIKGE
jgi:hypothetical protein